MGGRCQGRRRPSNGGAAMDETTWRTCRSPELLLGFLSGRASERKWRLFACACCRRIWDLVWEDEPRAAVEAGEALADGLLDQQTLEQARLAARQCWEE